MGNNPVSFIDPDGQFAFLAIAAYAAIGVVVNGAINTARDKPFFQNWGSAAIAGALSGGYLSAVGAGLNQHMPSLGIDLGGGFGFSISPAIALGSAGVGFGVNVGVGYSSEHFSAGVSFTGFGNTRSVGTGGASWEGRFGYGAAVHGEGFSLGLMSTKFYTTNGTNQQLGGIRLGYKDFSFTYQNDHMFGLNPVMADGGDRFRTTGAELRYKDWSVNLNMFTGDPGLNKSERERVENPDGSRTYIEKTSKYRLGALSLGYKEYNAGINSERVRNVFQNNLAHKRGFKYPKFEVLNNNIYPYFKYGTRFSYTLW